MSVIDKARLLIEECELARSQSAWEGAAGDLITLVDDELLDIEKDMRELLRDILKDITADNMLSPDVFDRLVSEVKRHE